MVMVSTLLPSEVSIKYQLLPYHANFYLLLDTTVQLVVSGRVDAHPKLSSFLFYVKDACMSCVGAERSRGSQSENSHANLMYDKSSKIQNHCFLNKANRILES